MRRRQQCAPPFKAFFATTSLPILPAPSPPAERVDALRQRCRQPFRAPTRLKVRLTPVMRFARRHMRHSERRKRYAAFCHEIMMIQRCVRETPALRAPEAMSAFAHGCLPRVLVAKAATQAAHASPADSIILRATLPAAYSPTRQPFGGILSPAAVQPARCRAAHLRERCRQGVARAGGAAARAAAMRVTCRSPRHTVPEGDAPPG